MPPRPSSLQAFLSAPLTWEDILFLVLMIAAVGFRFFRLSAVPGIYPDEATYLECSHNLLRGKFEWGVFTHTFLPRLPLPLFLMGVSSEVFGANLGSIRLVCACAGIATLLLVYLTPAAGFRKRIGLWALLFLTTHPFVVCYNRWAFTYNLLPLFGTAALLFGLRVSDSSRPSKNLDLMGMAACVGSVLLCEPIAVALLFYGVLVVGFNSPRRIFGFLVIALGPLGLYLLYLWLSQGPLLFSDIKAILAGRVQNQGAASEPGIILALASLWHAHGAVLWGGLTGVLLLPARLRRHAILLAVLWLAVMTVVSADDYTLLVRESIVLFPFAALGWGAIVERLLVTLTSAMRRDIHTILQKAMVVVSPSRSPAFPATLPKKMARGIVCLCTGTLVYWLLLQPARFLLEPHSYKTPLDFLCVNDTQALTEAARFIAQHTEASDLVLGDHFPILLPCRRSTLMQMAVVEGARGNPFFPYDTFRDRRAGPWRFNNAKYVLLTPYNREIESTFPGVASLMQETETWPVVFEKDQIRILVNPQHTGDEHSSSPGSQR